MCQHSVLLPHQDEASPPSSVIATQAVHLTAHWDFSYVHPTLGPSYYPRTGFQVRGERPKWVRSILMINHHHPMDVFLHNQHLCASSLNATSNGKKTSAYTVRGKCTLSKTIRINEKLPQKKKKKNLWLQFSSLHYVQNFTTLAIALLKLVH